MDTRTGRRRILSGEPNANPISGRNFIAPKGSCLINRFSQVWNGRGLETLSLLHSGLSIDPFTTEPGYSLLRCQCWRNSRYCKRIPNKQWIRQNRCRGIALPLVALVLAILCLGGASLLFLMRTEYESTTVRSLELQLENGTKSGVVLIQALLETQKYLRNERDELYNNSDMFRHVSVCTQEEGARADISFTILSPEFTNKKIDGLRYGLSNESNRLNLAAVLQWDREQPGTGRESLMKLPGMTEETADSILDWIDSDDSSRTAGAESSWYSSHGLPYSPREAVPVFLEELLLIRGVTRQQLYGNDESMNFCNAQGTSLPMAGSLLGIPDPAKSNLSSSPVSSTDTDSPGNDFNDNSMPWNYLLTVLSAEKDVMISPTLAQSVSNKPSGSSLFPNQNPDGSPGSDTPGNQPKIDLNMENLEFLHEEISRFLDVASANFVVFYRQYGPGEEADQSPVSSADRLRLSEAKPDFSLKGKYRLNSPLDLLDAVVTIPARGDVESQTMKSPYPARRSDIRRIFSLLDVTTTFRSPLIVGRININEAPRMVLRAIPGLTSGEVEQILITRPAPGRPVPNEFRHATWIYGRGIVSLAKMKTLFGKITCGGDVWRGQIVSWTTDSGSFNRAEVVVDATVTPPRQVFFKNLTPYGRGFNQNDL